MISSIKKFRMDIGVWWHAWRLARRAENLQTPEEWLREVRTVPAFSPIQQSDEITGFLKRIGRKPPRVICEIGTAGGGSLFLFTRVAAPDALLLTFDIAISPLYSHALRHFARESQQVLSLCLNSQDAASLERTRMILSGRPIDLLYIDGDHSYEGVRKDFETYSRLVRPGGLIALHDIVPDARSRGGIPSTADAGGVPIFWRELKSSYANTEEFVHDWNQEGCGIGLIQLPE